MKDEIDVGPKSTLVSVRRLASGGTLLCLLCAASARAADRIDTTIAAVTVYADRAQVTRTGRVSLPPEVKRFTIVGLPGWIDAESVRATLDPSSKGRILDLSVETSFLLESPEESVRKAEASVREVEEKLAALEDEEKVLSDEIGRLESLRGFTIDKLPKELATRDIQVKTLGETLEFVTESLRKDRRLLREVASKRRDLTPELVKHTHARDELAIRAQLRQSSVLVDLQGDGPATISLVYLTPGATWEPVGDLRVTGGGQTVALTQYASVSQTTGEDWTGALVSFSTQRPGEILGIPRAQALLLGEAGGGLGDVLSRVGESFERAKQSYVSQQQIVAQHDVDWQSNIASQQTIQTRVAESFARLAQRGTTAHFTAKASRPIRTDGKPVRISIGQSEFAAKVRLVAVPEVSLNVVRTAELVNRGAQPILPGRFSLFEDGAFVGTSELPFVAPGESFSAFLGVFDSLKVERTLDRSQSRIERGRSRTELTVSFVVTVENLGDKAATLQLTDRVPVAQLEDIEIDDVEVPNRAVPDANGVVRWTAQVQPHQKQTWRIGFTLEYPSDLLRRTREQPAATKEAPTNYDDIQNLEASF
ncbi:MAG: mucoidy inhibitor MuiA family protein [Deltaproteobacteria bacterium]|nr:mucoidy inhibitor MuiA family protein [Deltaproteobacteria bacterium]